MVVAEGEGGVQLGEGQPGCTGELGSPTTSPPCPLIMMYGEGFDYDVGGRIN